MYEIEPREIFYTRTGNLSQTTTLNKSLAEEFMRVSDLRLDVVITDSDKMPERSGVRVGSDILAWKSVAPLSHLSKITLRSQKYHQTEIADGQHRIQIHDKIIDDDIRKKSPESAEAYERMFLAKLNKEVKDALVETVRWEKLGFRTQYNNYLPYFIAVTNIPWVALNGGLRGVVFFLAAQSLVVNPFYTFISNISIERYRAFKDLVLPNEVGMLIPIPPNINPRDWKHAFMPAVPIDKWYKGTRFLARHGDNLIIAKD